MRSLVTASLLLIGCHQPGLDPRCPEGPEPEVQLGVFGREALVLGEGDTIPVWTPLQGGLVAGLNLLASDVARDADRLNLRIEDAVGGKLLASYQATAANFLCVDEDLRLWDRGMVLFIDSAASLPEDVDGRQVIIDVDLRFPAPTGWPSTVIDYRVPAVLEDRPPPD